MIVGNNVSLVNNILVTGNLVFASSATNTYAFDRSTLAQVWSVNYGGNLAWDTHRLLISDGNTIRSYTTIPTNPVTASITPAPLMASGITVSDKTYDGATATPLNMQTMSIAGILGSDSVSLDATEAKGAFASKDAGRGIDVTVSGLVLTGPQASDYMITGSAKGNIVPAALTVNGITVPDKVYDGTTAAKLIVSQLSLAGVVAGDQVTLSATNPSGVYAAKDVARAISVTLMGLALGGPQGFDYFIVPLTGNITPATVKISGLVADDKIYDGTTTAAINVKGAVLADVFSGDSVTMTAAAGIFARKDVGSGIPVNVVGITLGGPQAGDYTPGFSQQPLSAAITPAPLTVVGIVKDKIYDNTVSATMTPASAALPAVFAGDTVTLVQTNTTAVFQSKDVVHRCR